MGYNTQVTVKSCGLLICLLKCQYFTWSFISSFSPCITKSSHPLNFFQVGGEDLYCILAPHPTVCYRYSWGTHSWIYIAAFNPFFWNEIKFRVYPNCKHLYQQHEVTKTVLWNCITIWRGTFCIVRLCIFEYLLWSILNNFISATFLTLMNVFIVFIISY